ncbi:MULTISPECIES: recombinase family protein [unclassified Mesorhizobium]|uniref:recombinase family protein n=1 Tax=unclassified Mesorhizobium TaxID=325217 RepID=UPI003335DC43
MTRIGYARTSTTDQNLAAQIAALKAAGCEVIREEQKSGSTLEGRPQLNTILDFIHAGETLVVTGSTGWPDRCATCQVIVDRLKTKGAHLFATEQPVDTSTAAGKAFFDMLGVFAEFETNLRRERQESRCAPLPGLVEPAPKGLLCNLGEWRTSLLAALANASHVGTVPQHHRVPVEIDDLQDPQPVCAASKSSV